MKKNKILLTITAMIASVTVLSGCTNKSEVTLDINKLADDLKSNIKYSDTLSEIQSDMIKQLYPISENEITAMKVYVSTGATAEEIAVFEVKEDKFAQSVKEAVEKRIGSQKESFEDYRPEEMPKLEDAVLEVKGKYVILSVSSEDEKAESIIDKYLK